MHIFHTICRIFIFFFLFSFFPLNQIVLANSREEMQLLQLYYRTDDLVVSPTRHLKPICQVAENVTVVTAKEIEAMNAHTVAEVLNRIPGLFISFNREFGTNSFIQVQGTEHYHTLVLVDGIRWNFLSDGGAETNTIPVGIIDRIEIIKGPASSSWGSSLGGVINIITKSLKNTTAAGGTIYTAFGERNTQDVWAGYNGSLGKAGYYLFAGRQDSDGLRESRSYDNNNLYAKINIPVRDDLLFKFSFGYSEPEQDYGDFPSADISSSGGLRTLFGTGALNADITDQLSLHLAFKALKKKFYRTDNALGLGLWFLSAPGERVLETVNEETNIGGTGKLVWTGGVHTVVLGADADFGELDQTITVAPVYQLADFKAHPDMDTWAIFANDTITLDRWSIIPGVRYDNNSITGSFVSPSLGITFQACEDTVFRATVARGFTVPPLVYTSGGGLFFEPNPDLDPEEVWSYQAGVESGAIKYFRVKASVFRHSLKDVLSRKKNAAGPGIDMYVNSGSSRRQGVEVALKSAPYYHFSFSTGFSYVHYSPPSNLGASDTYAYHLMIEYDNEKFINGQLFGHYLWWDFDPQLNADYDEFIWDLNLNKSLCSFENYDAKLFLTAHNLFNGSQYQLADSKNPKRWVEAGMRITF